MTFALLKAHPSVQRPLSWNTIVGNRVQYQGGIFTKRNLRAKSNGCTKFSRRLHVWSSRERWGATICKTLGEDYETNQSKCKTSFGRKSFANHVELANFLRSNGVDTTSWGTGTTKTVKDLWTELEDRESVIAVLNNGLGRKQLVRRVEVVRVIVRRRVQENFVLIEKRQVFADGRERQRGTVMAEKMQAGETPLEAAKRGLLEELSGRLDDPNDIQSLSLSSETQNDRRSSISYPNLESEYEIHEVNALVPTLPLAEFYTDEGPPGSPSKRIHWSWHDTSDGHIPKGKGSHRDLGVVDLREFLLGRWNFQRVMVDAGSPNEDIEVMSGMASFTAGDKATPQDLAQTRMTLEQASCVLYSEIGMIQMNGVPVNTTRKMAYTFPNDDTRVAHVTFLDGPNKDGYFHSLNLTSGRWEATHHCGPDLYKGKFNVLSTRNSIKQGSNNSERPNIGPKKWEVTW
eukprot:CAMPEP_0184493604 /NCGR_PEP_ID=MMETSP0113_2-20130426/26458_1 /TAXON_ID=91329 /ORGANISM="Norrisiella sphaerica, Strain BC52" /LENGTH=458 /DNA_ID=CAMNT_0026878927 /DNA_START=143 /DNA_END=1516 /DNA_ORIENTATION=+